MTAAAQVRIGLIGCGRGTRVHHLRAIRAAGGFTVEAVCDIDKQAAQAVARSYGIPRWVQSYRDLLPLVDAVAVVTPPASHAEITIEAIDQRLHVFLEKPMALSVAECDRIVEAASRSGRVVLVAHNSRWHPLAARAREIVRSGTLGTVRAIRSVYTHAHPDPGDHWHRRRESGGGVLFNDGVHHFDLWRWLLDVEIVDAKCMTTDSERFEDDTCVVAARLSNGALATATLSFSTTPNSELEIFGARGSLLLNLYRFDGLRLRQSGELPGNLRTRLDDLANLVRFLPAGLRTALHGGGFDSTYAAMWSHFAQCVRDGTQPLCTAADGRAAVAAALMCRGRV